MTAAVPSGSVRKRSSERSLTLKHPMKVGDEPHGAARGNAPLSGGRRPREASRISSSPTCFPDRLRWHRPDPPSRLRPRRDPGAATGSPAPLKRRGAGFRLPPWLRPGSQPPLPPSLPSCFGSGRTSEPPQGFHRPPPPRLAAVTGQGSSKAELRLDRKGLAGTGIAGMVRRTRDLGGDHEAHGRNERRVAGNGDMTQRTRQRSKALKSAASRGSDEPPAPPLRWGSAARTERPQLRLRSHSRPPSGGPGRCLRCDSRE
jgi:hypothetical protein